NLAAGMFVDYLRHPDQAAFFTTALPCPSGGGACSFTPGGRRFVRPPAPPAFEFRPDIALEWRSGRGRPIVISVVLGSRGGNGSSPSVH
ncbi:hypothetical protein, partial [Nocardia farcinica]|uniref:hypothetical protein n=1 Tax=Nocardia farcinica TaxID=37329 RepID=UPI0024569B11